MKFYMTVLIAVFFLAIPLWIFSAEPEEKPVEFPGSEEYQPITSDQAMGWWESLTTEERIQAIINLDMIENTAPELRGLILRAFLVKGDLVIQFVSEDGSEGVLMDHAYLHYRVTIPPVKMEKFAPPRGVSPEGAVLIGIGSFIVGSLVGSVISK